jgi:type II secretory pathway component GspD/PulD (secretin)
MRFAVKNWYILLTIAAVVIGIPVYADELTTAEKSDDNISLNLKDIDIRSAIEAMFRNSGKNFALDPSVAGLNVPAVSFTDVPFDTALKSLTRSMGLVYRIDQNIYIISKKPETTLAAYTPSLEPTPEIEPLTSSPDVIIDKVPLNYSSATEILAIMSGNTNNGFGNGYGGYGGFGSYGGFGNGMSNLSFGGLTTGFGSNNSGYSGYGYGSNSGTSGYGGYGGYSRRW